MKILPVITAFMTLNLLTACNNETQSTSANMGRSAQKEADEFSKSFNKQATYKPKTPDHAKKSTTTKNSAPTDAGIVGMPKGTVEGMKNIIEDTKDAVNKAVDSVTGKMSDDKTDSNKATVSDSKTSSQTTKNTDKNAVSVTNSSSAQTAAEKEAPAEVQSDMDNKNASDSAAKSNTSSAGIVGLPQGVVEGAKAVVEDTKNAVTNAVDSVTGKVPDNKTGTNKASGNDSKTSSQTTKNTDKNTAPATNASSAQTAAEKEAPADKTQSDMSDKSSDEGHSEKSDTASAGIVGLPQGVVEGAKTMAKETKDVVNKAVESVTGKDESSTAKSALSPAPH